MDVSSHCTNIDHEEGAEACFKKLEERKNKSIPSITIKNLILMILKSNAFRFGNEYFFFFFSIWVLFHEHSRFTGQQGKGEGIYLTPLYHFHPLHRHLDISRAITAESSPLHIAGSRTRTGNLWLPSASR